MLKIHYRLYRHCFWGAVEAFRGCGVDADGTCSLFLWRCTRRSECRRAEEKNGWLWSPKQECVEIVSFYPPNLSCKKTEKVRRWLSLRSIFPFVLCFSFRLHPHAAQYNLTYVHIQPTCTAWALNNFHRESETLDSKSSCSVLIHKDTSKLAYYNQPGWLCSRQPEDGKPLFCTISLSNNLTLISWLLPTCFWLTLYFLSVPPSFCCCFVFTFEGELFLFFVTPQTLTVFTFSSTVCSPCNWPETAQGIRLQAVTLCKIKFPTL